jgi:hypothetical protein
MIFKPGASSSLNSKNPEYLISMRFCSWAKEKPKNRKQKQKINTF